MTKACGPKGKHDPDRAAARHGTEDGSVTLGGAVGGRRVPVRRPWVRAADGPRSCGAGHEVFNGTELLGRMAVERAAYRSAV